MTRKLKIEIDLTVDNNSTYSDDAIKDAIRMAITAGLRVSSRYKSSVFSPMSASNVAVTFDQMSAHWLPHEDRTCCPSSPEGQHQWFKCRCPDLLHSWQCVFCQKTCEQPESPSVP